MDKNKLIEQCKDIAETLEMYVNGQMVRCFECGEIMDDNELYTDDKRIDKCPCCGATLDDDTLEQLDLLDYLDGVLDIQITRSGLDRDGNIVGVRLLVAFGGPTIWVDTLRGLVTLNWWTDHAECEIDWRTCDLINDEIAEIAC